MCSNTAVGNKRKIFPKYLAVSQGRHIFTAHMLINGFEIMSSQTIDTYKLTSLEEPSDEILSQLMKEVAEEAKCRGEEANRKFFDNIASQMKREIQDWNRRNAL